MKLGNIRRVDPGFNRESTAGSDIETGTGRNPDIGIRVVEQESLSHFTGTKTDHPFQHAVVGANNIIGITFPRPPTHYPRRGRITGLEWVDRQQRVGAVRGTVKVGHQHCISARLTQLHIDQHQGCIRRPTDVRPVEFPLVTQWQRATGRHTECRRATYQPFDSSAAW